MIAWCEVHDVDLILGLPGNAVLAQLFEETADDVRVRRAEAQAPVLRRTAEIRCGAKSWHCKQRIAARIEATTLGLDIRCVVTSLPSGKVHDAIPRPQPLASAEFPTLRLLKVAARVTETATQVRIVFATACPQAALFRSVARSMQPAGPRRAGQSPRSPCLANPQRPESSA